MSNSVLHEVSETKLKFNLALAYMTLEHPQRLRKWKQNHYPTSKKAYFRLKSTPTSLKLQSYGFERNDHPQIEFEVNLSRSLTFKAIL